MKATNDNGTLRKIEDCEIKVGNHEPIIMYILPDISDGKGANYSPTPAIGRSNPIISYSHSEVRTISWTMHLMITNSGVEEDQTAEGIKSILKCLESAVYPSKSEQPYAPPPICHIKCKNILQTPNDEEEICAVLKSYSIKFPTDVVWDEKTYIPYKLDIDLQFEVVYDSMDLPYAEDIFQL